MRIALFHNLPSGGAKRTIYEWTRRLVTRHHVRVFTLTTADHEFCDVRPLVDRHEEFEFEASTLFSSPLGRLNNGLRWRDLQRLTRLGRQIAARIDASGCDVVLANTCLFTTLPAFLQFVATPAVFFLHEPVGRAATPPARRHPVGRDRIRRWLDRYDPLISLYRRDLDSIHQRVINKVPQLLANSSFTAERVARAYGVHAASCRLGVDTAAFDVAAHVQKQGHVLSVGELSPRKGFDFVIDSLAHIPVPSRPTLRLACNSVIAEERDRVERLAVESGVKLEIRVGLGTADLAREYNEARLLVYAPFNEPFGLVSLEAMACGLPVVAVREGGVAESVVHERTGLLVERDAARFAAAVQGLLAKPSVLADYGRNGRTHVVAWWTWDRSVADLEDHLAIVARSPRGQRTSAASHSGQKEPRINGRAGARSA